MRAHRRRRCARPPSVYKPLDAPAALPTRIPRWPVRGLREHPYCLECQGEGRNVGNVVPALFSARVTNSLQVTVLVCASVCQIHNKLGMFITSIQL
jgi:hypothetical protein